MDQPIEILMIDDDIDNYNAYKNICAKNRILLRYKSNLKEGIDEIRESKKIVAVILDGKGFINPEQPRGSDKEDFVHEALSQLKLLELQQDRHIPKIVLTAWYDQLKDSLESRVRVFDKKKVGNDDASMTEMFDYLKREVKNSDVLKIRRKYSDVFAVTSSASFETSSQSVDTKMFTLLQKTETGKIEKQDFNLVREVLESILVVLGDDKNQFIPKDLFHPDGRPNLEYCMRYMNGLQIGFEPNILHKELPKKKRVPDTVAIASQFVKDMSSDLSHFTTDNWTKYGFVAVVLSLCEILLWYGGEFNG